MSNSLSAVLLGSKQIEIREVVVPELRTDSILLRIEGTGVCGTDRHLYHGRAAMPYPTPLGHEIVGHVEKFGSDAMNHITVVGGTITEGTRVAVLPGQKPCGNCYACRYLPNRPALCTGRDAYGFCNADRYPYLSGGWANYLVVVPGSWLYVLPDSLPLERAVLIEPMATAVRAIERGLAPGLPNMREGFGFGQSAAVVGAGTIGLCAVAALAALGANPLVVIDVVDERLELAKSLGASHTINYKTTADSDARLSAVQSITEGAGVDVVVEAAGIPDAFAESLRLVRRGGSVCEVGHFVDTGTVNLHPFDICSKDISIYGSFAFPTTEFRVAISLLQESRGPIEQLVHGKFPVSQAEAAILGLDNPSHIKHVIVPEE